MIKIKRRALEIITIVFFSCNAISANNKELENGLIDAFRFNHNTMERVGDSGKAIQAYMKENFIKKRPNKRVDYTDYYILMKPTKFMGYDLIMIEEEYMTHYIGCCVNEGAGVVVKVMGDIGNLEKFANKNACKILILKQEDFQFDVDNYGINFKVSEGNYASLSCRIRDINE